ncbi:hypothetical protein HDU76_004402 [Blyttiomyces sp. JEL0837]|nr:hypothetical protein HDU76_004402 [Blyttiomyces sp. JEL0837]
MLAQRLLARSSTTSSSLILPPISRTSSSSLFQQQRPISTIITSRLAPHSSTTNAFQQHTPTTTTQTRGIFKITNFKASLEGIKIGKEYLALGTDAERAAFVPKPRGTITDPKSFLTAIGRSCADVSDKFKSWDHLFTASSNEMKENLSIQVDKRRYILAWREWFKRGIDPYEIEIAERSKKFMRVKKKVRLARLKKKGLA